MLQIVAAPIERAPTRADAAVAPRTATDQADVLAKTLAQVDPILDDIRRARSFQFIDDGSARTWQRLSRAADEIQVRIKRLAPP